MADASPMTAPRYEGKPHPDATAPSRSAVYSDFSAAIDLVLPHNVLDQRPCQVVIFGDAEAASQFDYSDGAGDHSLPVPQGAVIGPIRMSPLSIAATTDVAAIWVFWE